MLLVGGGLNLLYHSGLRSPQTNTPTNRSVPLEPYYWVLPSGAAVDRAKLMVALNNLQGVYVRASYGVDANAQARLSGVSLDAAEEADDPAAVPAGQLVPSVELCECPPGYHGASCESCSVGYYRQSEGPFGPICAPCNCHGHADVCHPLDGRCVTLRPADPLVLEGLELTIVEFCHFRPDLCVVDEAEEVKLGWTSFSPLIDVPTFLLFF